MENKKDAHIDLSLKSQVLEDSLDSRFDYHPYKGHVQRENLEFGKIFLEKTFKFPLWISSMTGGGKDSYKINRRLANAACEFGLGISLGSLKVLLESDKNKKVYKDYAIREILGHKRPYYANVGISSIEKLLEKKNINKLLDLVASLDCDGLSIHLNPIQEFIQEDGEQIKSSIFDVLCSLLDSTSIPLIIKEVGQGMSKRALSSFMKLPFKAIELASFGGTNFTYLELLKNKNLPRRDALRGLAYVGHSKEEMLCSIQELLHAEQKLSFRCTSFIVSGGIRDALDLYYYHELLNSYSLEGILGMAFGVLKWAKVSQKALNNYIASLIEGVKFASSFLDLKDKDKDMRVKG